MDSLLIAAREDTPEINFSSENGIFEMKGKSLPEDVSSFYIPVLDWLNNYALDPRPETQLNFRLSYFNTASSKLLLDIFSILETIQEKGNKVVVNWYYQEYDEDMRDAGKEYSEIVEVPFEYFSF